MHPKRTEDGTRMDKGSTPYLITATTIWTSASGSAVIP